MDTAARPLFPREVAHEVYQEIARHFQPLLELGRKGARCGKICAVGGYRRRKAEMKDLEVLYVPAFTRIKDPADLLGSTVELNDSERVIEEMVAARLIEPRLGANGNQSWGPAVKLARHIPTGLPLDIFSTVEANYHNRLVVTTGPRELNIRIAQAALNKGYEWEVFQGGFVPQGMTWKTAGGCRLTMRSELELFNFVGMDYSEPEGRK